MKLLLLVILAIAAPRPESAVSPQPARTGAPQRAAGHDADVVASGVPNASPTNGVGIRHGADSGASQVGEAAPADLSAVTLDGIASWMPEQYGRDYLAMRVARGTVVTICGPGGCWRHARVNDYGPSGRLHPERIADIAVGRWLDICGVPASLGLCPVTVIIEQRVPLPETDTEGAS